MATVGNKLLKRSLTNDLSPRHQIAFSCWSQLFHRPLAVSWISPWTRAWNKFCRYSQKPVIFFRPFNPSVAFMILANFLHNFLKSCDDVSQKPEIKCVTWSLSKSATRENCEKLLIICINYRFMCCSNIKFRCEFLVTVLNNIQTYCE